MSESATPNRLLHETSPYLLQHAYNPVDWHPWGSEALDRAKAENKPILLSIGYSACHWCHVMERESFENTSIAALMNQHYICVKVDREERPDLDEIYMQATLAMNQGQGGWPMTVFLTPDQYPIFAGTYFPPTDRWGRPGFGTLLTKIAEGWAKDSDIITKQAGRFSTRLQESMRLPPPLSVGQDEIDQAVDQFSRDFDSHFGGFGNAPKFPPATGLSLLLRHYHRTKNDHTLHMVQKTLDAMASGGMCDQIGGGFARYSTDERWLVPHFEKMLYDNALLTKTYLEAFQVTKNEYYKQIATEILDYILREMTSPDGGFYSATDADSEGVEGKFFVWTPEQIQELVPEEDAKRFCAYYDITQQGNWEDHSIPHTPQSFEEVTHELRCTPEELKDTIARVRPLVYEARLKRIPPGLDDKIITAWNGMMIGAMAEGARVLNNSRYLTGAMKAADFILTTLSKPDGGLFRTYRSGKAHLNAYLEDYAFFIEGLIDLYEAVGEERFLTEAVRLADRLLTDFSDQEQGGFFTTAHDHESLIVRGREGPDGATPSGNAVAASVLARLSFHFDRQDMREAAIKAVRCYGQQMAQIPRAFSKALMAADLLLNSPLELAVVGMPGSNDHENLLRVIHSQFIPNRIIAYQNSERSTSAHPLLSGKTLIEGKAALYICQNYACQAPITDPNLVESALNPQQVKPPTLSPSHHQTLTTPGLQGSATSRGTASYVSKLLASPHQSRPTENGYTRLGTTGLTTSRIGFGCYRVGLGDEEHGQALRKAFREGCNVIDTSTNYGDGESEQLVGSILAELIRNNEITREEVLVVSKIGYVQGQNLKKAKSREHSGSPYPDMVKYGEGIWHCLHPEFLEDQLTLSLDRLGLATLDICLLHNPEYFLSDAKNKKLATSQETLSQLRDEFYRRLTMAFTYLESQVTTGRIQYYGVSSNTCTSPPDEPEATSLFRMLESAQTAAQQANQPTHHFRVLQLPFNLLESGAMLTPNTGKLEDQTVLEYAAKEDIAIFVNRPLNAIPPKGGAIVRLADPQTEPVGISFKDQQQKVSVLEEEFKKEFVPTISYSGKGLEPKDYFTWADTLEQVRPSIQNLQHWGQIEAQMIAPHVNQVTNVLTKHLKDHTAEQWQVWRSRYIPELLSLLQIMRSEAAEKNKRQTQILTNLLDPLLPEGNRSRLISQKALWILSSTPGVTCVLNGIRKPSYVNDSLTILSWAPLPNVKPIYETAKEFFKS